MPWSLSSIGRVPARSGAIEQVGGFWTLFNDRTLQCKDCGDEFVFSAGEQRFFAEKGLNHEPQRCAACRAAARQARQPANRAYHAAVCGVCGDQAKVPFAPRPDRPVYCSSCFDKVRSGLIEPAQAPAGS